MTTSLIVSTYNSPKALRLVLLSVFHQIQLPDEIIVVDDGSTQETKSLIETLQNQSPVPLIHVWHEDLGFRAAAIRNKGIVQAKGEYIIQIDGDIIIDKFFIQDHLSIARKQSFVQGSRVLLNKDLSEKLKEEGHVENIFSYLDVLKGNVGNILNAIRLPILRNLIGKSKSRDGFKTRGCNISFWKEDLLAVNGYNEDIEGWGREDSELCIRLCNIGVMKKTLKMGGVCYHLYHETNSRSRLAENDRILSRTIEEKIKVIPNGINKL